MAVPGPWPGGRGRIWPCSLHVFGWPWLWRVAGRVAGWPDGRGCGRMAGWLFACGRAAGWPDGRAVAGWPGHAQIVPGRGWTKASQRPFKKPQERIAPRIK